MGVELRDAAEALCYPGSIKAGCEKRVLDAALLGVLEILDAGGPRIGRIGVLGKGHASIVLLARTIYGRAAVKVRRTDSRRKSLVEEALLLREASRLGVSPAPYAWSRDVIVMEYLDGPVLEQYIEDAQGQGLLHVAGRLLEKAVLLDILGIDHGELSRPYRHVIIVREEPYIIDFESASKKRKPSNLTSLVSALFIKPGKLNIRNKAGLTYPTKELVALLRKYKASDKDEKKKIASNILSLLGLLPEALDSL